MATGGEGVGRVSSGKRKGREEYKDGRAKRIPGSINMAAD